MVVAEFSQRRIDASLRVSEVATVAIPVLFAGSAFHLPYAVQVAAYLTLFAAIIFLYRNRARDEFLQKHWNAGASAGFFMVCLWGFLAPFLTGFWDGVNGNPRGTANAHEIVSVGILPIALSAFFLAFQVNRWRNR